MRICRTKKGRFKKCRRRSRKRSKSRRKRSKSRRKRSRRRSTRRMMGAHKHAMEKLAQMAIDYSGSDFGSERNQDPLNYY